MALSVVIPALNEEEAIGETVRATTQCLTAAGIEHEIVVVDDGSNDASGRIAAECGALVITHLYKLGYGRSVKDGIRVARYDAIAITDADGTYPIEEIPRLYELYRKGYHMVVGQRTGAEYKESSVKIPLRLVLKLLVEYTAARPIPDINSGLRIINRNMAIKFFDRLCDTFSFTTSLTLAFIMNGLYVEHVPIVYHRRKGSSKVRLLQDALNTLQYVAEAAIFYNPLRIFLAFSAALVAFGCLLILINVFLHREGLLLAIIALFIASTLSLGLGLIAVLLKQILSRSEIESTATWSIGPTPPSLDRAAEPERRRKAASRPANNSSAIGEG